VVGGVFVALGTGESGREVAAGDPAWAAAVSLEDRREVASAVVVGTAGAPYRPGYLALQLGPLMERAVRALDALPDVLLVNATGRDHPRGAGLALHLGAVLGLPTVGVTDQPLVAVVTEAPLRRRAPVPLTLRGEPVGYVVRTGRGRHPVVVHAAWRTDPDTALGVVRSVTGKVRTPEPLRRARRLAREQRARDEGRASSAVEGPR
jgi:deoxyribonuclease V